MCMTYSVSHTLSWLIMVVDNSLKFYQLSNLLVFAVFCIVIKNVYNLYPKSHHHFLQMTHT